jgi:two-component system cell cycle sensor histidine kinase/response regulator CckA
MSQLLQILIVEDNVNDANLLVRKLRRSGFKFEWQRVDTEIEYLAKLNSGLDLILSDYDMPQFNGLRALHLLKQQPALEIPFIIVSGTIGEDKAVVAIQQGAADYLLKDRMSRLPAAVRGALKEIAERGERKRLEARFIEVQKMEVVGRFTAGVAHDFNNALAIIMGYSELVLEDLGPGHALRKYLEEVLHAAKRAAGLTQQLLIFSRKQTVQPIVLDLNEVVQSMEKMLRRLVDENIEMTMVCEKSIGQIKADSGYIWQVLLNLVVNARDAMPNGGKLTIGTSSVTLNETSVKAHAGTVSGTYAVLSVSDTGTGMTEEVKARLFEAFFTTKEPGKGTGLGLVTCQTIVRLSGGRIEVSSELGKGTTFKVYFPRIEHRVHTAASSIDKTGPARRGTETLLVVEDEPSLRHLAQGVLEGQGYDVLTAMNGQDALRVASEHKGHPIRLVLTDVIMPQMGGKVMGDRLKLALPDVKILFTSGYTNDAIAHHGVLAQGIEFLPKPYTPVALARKVRDLLDG